MLTKRCIALGQEVLFPDKRSRNCGLPCPDVDSLRSEAFIPPPTATHSKNLLTSPPRDLSPDLPIKKNFLNRISKDFGLCKPVYNTINITKRETWKAKSLLQQPGEARLNQNNNEKISPIKKTPQNNNRASVKKKMPKSIILLYSI